jgi:hypothetical protein
MKKLCLVAASTVTTIVMTAGPATVVTHTPVPLVATGIFCKIFPSLCR